jgi:hypothetical protein
MGAAAAAHYAAAFDWGKTAVLLEAIYQGKNNE